MFPRAFFPPPPLSSPAAGFPLFLVVKLYIAFFSLFFFSISREDRSTEIKVTERKKGTRVGVRETLRETSMDHARRCEGDRSLEFRSIT